MEQNSIRSQAVECVWYRLTSDEEQVPNTHTRSIEAMPVQYHTDPWYYWYNAPGSFGFGHANEGSGSHDCKKGQMPFRASSTSVEQNSIKAQQPGVFFSAGTGQNIRASMEQNFSKFQMPVPLRDKQPYSVRGGRKQGKKGQKFFKVFSASREQNFIKGQQPFPPRASSPTVSVSRGTLQK